MDFFHSLTLDLKMLVVAIAGCTLLALFSGNRGAEKRYMLILAVLAAVGVYRFNQTTGQEQAQLASESSPPTKFVKAPDKHTPLVSTSAK